MAATWRTRLLHLFGFGQHPQFIDPLTGKEIPTDEKERSKFDQQRHERDAVERERLQLYNMYDMMDDTETISSLLDMISEDATSPSLETGHLVWFHADTSEMESELNKLRDRLHLNDPRITTSIVRTMCLYGHAFERTIYNPTEGVKAIVPEHGKYIKRVEDEFGRLIGFKRDNTTWSYTLSGDDAGESLVKESDVSEPWDYIQFTLPSRRRVSPDYGTSLCKGAIRPWKQMLLGEDAALLYRINRANSRYKWKIDVGNTSEIEAARTMQTARSRMRKGVFMTKPTLTGATFDAQFDPITPLEDLFLAVRPDSLTDVEVLESPMNSDPMEDVRYYRAKVYSVFRVPLAFMGFEDSAHSDIVQKTRLTNQHVLYARLVRKVQTAYRAAIMRLCKLHLRIMSTDGDDLDFDNHRFTVIMEPVSYLDEADALDLVEHRATIATTLLGVGQQMEDADHGWWARYVAKTVLKLTDREIEELFPPAAESEEPAEPPPAGGKPPRREESLSAKAQELIEELVKNPEKFNRLRGLLGMDIVLPEEGADTLPAKLGKEAKDSNRRNIRDRVLKESKRESGAGGSEEQADSGRASQI